jgi:hypothetical protein
MKIPLIFYSLKSNKLASHRGQIIFPEGFGKDETPLDAEFVKL